MEDQPRLTKKERRQLQREERRHEEMRESKNLKRKQAYTWVLASFLIIGVIVGLFVLSRQEPDASRKDAPSVTADDWILGDQTARATLIEYSDFQCPACAVTHPIIKRLTETFGKDLRFVYRHFPLESIHKNAEPAARAAEAAGLQGKFWDMHDLLFEHQDEWSKADNPHEAFERYAASLALSVEQFKVDMDSQNVRDRVNTHLRDAERLRLRGTPTFFLNGKQIANPTGYDAFERAIRQAVNADL